MNEWMKGGAYICSISSKNAVETAMEIFCQATQNTS